MQEAAQREIEEAMKKVKEAQSLITAAADSGYCILGVTFLYQFFFLCYSRVKVSKIYDSGKLIPYGEHILYQIKIDHKF